MKHMVRKPMLPVLLLAVMVFGTSFLGAFRADIAAGWDQVDRLYNDTVVTVELLPDAGWDDLQMKAHKSIMIENMPEVAETLSVMECFYVLRDGSPLPEPEEGQEYVAAETAVIRGTNNIAWLAEYWDLTIQWQDGWSAEDFCVTEELTPCLVRQELLDTGAVELGGVIGVSPALYYDEVAALAPEIPLVAVGVYSDAIGRTGDQDLLVPQESFLNGPKLLYSGDMMYRCYYRAFALRLNPEYNREYDRVETELEGILYDLSDYTFVTNARALENAARPLIQKLQMQELLVLPLSLLLCAAAVVVAVLLGLGFETEVFLRLMWGEKRLTVFACLMAAVCLWLGVCVMAACGGTWLVAGHGWLTWAAGFGGTTAGLCALASAAPVVRACCRNLVNFYQSREGE